MGNHKEQKLYYTTGCDVLDLVVAGKKGKKGFEGGTFINIVGDSSTGKSFICAELLASNFHRFNKQLKFNYDDGEAGFKFDTKSMYGMEVIGEDNKISETVEELDVNLRAFVKDIKKEEPAIYILDSLDSLKTEAKLQMAEDRDKLHVQGKSLKIGSYEGDLQKFLSQHFFKNHNHKIKKTNTLVVLVSQVRDNINAGMYGRKNIQAGGRALQFYTTTRLWLFPMGKIKSDNGLEVGIMVRAKTEKVRGDRPFRECIFPIYFKYGIDNIGANIDFLFDLRGKDGKLLGSSNNILWAGSTSVEKNKDTLMQWLKDSGYEAECKEARKEKENKDILTVGWVKDWVNFTTSTKVKESYQDFFGQSYTRDELRTMIAQGKDLQEELYNRVLFKWEDIEEKADPGLGSKY